MPPHTAHIPPVSMLRTIGKCSFSFFFSLPNSIQTHKESNQIKQFHILTITQTHTTWHHVYHLIYQFHAWHRTKANTKQARADRMKTNYSVFVTGGTGEWRAQCGRTLRHHIYGVSFPAIFASLVLDWSQYRSPFGDWWQRLVEQHMDCFHCVLCALGAVRHGRETEEERMLEMNPEWAHKWFPWNQFESIVADRTMRSPRADASLSHNPYLTRNTSQPIQLESRRSAAVQASANERKKERGETLLTGSAARRIRIIPFMMCASEPAQWPRHFQDGSNAIVRQQNAMLFSVVACDSRVSFTFEWSLHVMWDAFTKDCLGATNITVSRPSSSQELQRLRVCLLCAGHECQTNIEWNWGLEIGELW